MGKDIVVLGLSRYIRPEVRESVTRKWVLNGDKNSFYKYIIDKKNGSPTNSAIINAYCDLIYGKGLRSEGFDIKEVEKIINPKELKKIIYDFELFGENKMQIIRKRGKKIHEISHIPNEKVVPSVADEEENINSYWYSKDWGSTLKNPPKEIASFGGDEDIEIYHIKPYCAGRMYFSDPDYIACLPYCEMEEEIANLNVNSIKNGLSAGYIINIPNGNTLTPEEKDKFEREVKKKLTGSPNASRFILSFNGVDQEITVTPMPVNENIHKQWEFLTNESRQQIITGHRLTSPSLAGVSIASGFSSTADEMDMAEEQLMKRVIYPKQRYIIDALEEILSYYGINTKLSFIPLTEKKEPNDNPHDIEKEDDIELSEERVSPTGLLADALIEMGSDYSDEDWYMLGYSDVDYKTDDDIYDLIQLTSTGVAKPNAKSEQDSNDIIIRYRYVGHPTPQREFCEKMMKANKLYRKEDIIQMGNRVVNEGFGMSPTPNKPYSIWLYKGGGKISEKHPNGTCRHKWQREIYLKKGSGVDINSPLAETISTSEARRRGYKVPINESNVSLTPNKNKT